MEAALSIQAVSLATAPESAEVPISKTATGDVRRVELEPLPGMDQLDAIEKEIQHRIQQESHRLVHDVLKRSASMARPPPSSESARATLGAHLQRALATTCPDDRPTQPPPPPPEEPPVAPKTTLANPFTDINPPHPQ